MASIAPTNTNVHAAQVPAVAAAVSLETDDDVDMPQLVERDKDPDDEDEPEPPVKKPKYNFSKGKKSVGRRRKGKNRRHSKNNYTKAKAAAAVAVAATTTPRVTQVDTTTTETPTPNNTIDLTADIDPNIVTPKITHKDRRLMIHLHYKQLSYPPPEEWDGQGGTVSEIAKKVYKADEKVNRKKIKFVISNSWNAFINDDHDYDPTSRKGRDPLGVKIKDGSVEQNLISEWLEDGLGCRGAHKMLEGWLAENGRSGETIGLSAVRSAVKRMTKIEYKAGKRPSGSSDPNSAWAIANRRFTAQILLRAGKLKEEDLGDDLKVMVDGQLVLPECLQMQHLTKIDFDKVGWWDEVHKKAVTGMVNMTGTVTQFPRNEQGKYDPNGKYKDEVFHTTVKFEKEMRKSFGVATVNGKGVRMHPFDYTSKKILTMTVFKSDALRKPISRCRLEMAR